MAKMLKVGIAELLEKQPSTSAEKDAYIRELQSSLKDLAAEVTNLQEMAAWMRKAGIW